MNTLSQYVVEEGKIKVPYEDMQIEIPLNFNDKKDIVLYKIIRDLQKEVGKLKGKVLTDRLIIDNLPDDKAEEKIKEYLLDKKKNGKTKVGMIDLIRAIPLPTEQIERIMDKLQKGNEIKETEENV